jgi:hypothetical protein
MGKKKLDDQYSDEETIARAEAALKRMLATPHQPHSEMKLGKHRAKAGTIPSSGVTSGTGKSKK